MDICPVQLVDDGPSDSAENSAVSPVHGAASVATSAVAFAVAAVVQFEPFVTIVCEIPKH